MDNNVTTFRKRKSSLGRSSLIERSINLLENFLSSDYDEEEFSAHIVNNVLLGEFRSVLWRVYLGILPTPHSKKSWIQATKASRANFEKIVSDTDYKQALSFYNCKLNAGSQSDSSAFNLSFNFEEEFELIKNELEVYSGDYDIFKSEFLKKSFLTIYLAWRCNNKVNLNKNAITFISRILAILIYSLYPCIIHLNENFHEISDDEADIKNIFYFLNLEDYYEHDIYEIFEKLLNFSEMRKYIIDYSQGALENKLHQEIKNISNQDHNLAEILDKKLSIISANESRLKTNNFLEDVSYIYLFTLNKDLLQMLHSKEIDVYNLTANYYLSFFYNATKFENVTYYIDNVLMYCKSEELRFLGYLVISTLINLEDEFANLSKKEIDDLLLNFPLLKRDPKDIVGKALKIRQKINKKFSITTEAD